MELPCLDPVQFAQFQPDSVFSTHLRANFLGIVFSFVCLPPLIFLASISGKSCDYSMPLCPWTWGSLMRIRRKFSIFWGMRWFLDEICGWSRSNPA
jgi:hypothetical protein